MTLKLSQISNTRMDVELLKFINADMTWNVMRKGRTSMTRRPRKPGAGGFQFVYNIHELAESKKVIDGSSKKRRISHQSTSPPSKTPCLKGEEGLSRGPQTPSVCYEDSTQRCWSGSLTKTRKTKSKSRLTSSKTKKTKKGGLDPNDFSGIALLADVACSIFIQEAAHRAVDFSISKEHTAPVEEKKVETLKELRLHWDLNTVMDDWEDPCDDLQIESVKHEETCNVISSEKTYELVEDLGLIGAKAANSASKSEVVDSLTHSAKSEDLLTSPTSVLKDQIVANCDGLKLDPQKECCGSNDTQEENKIDVDYDSPFEDGELREPIEEPEKETVNESGVIYTDELVDHGQTVVKEVGANNEIKHVVHAVELEKDNCERKESYMDESTSFDVCRNGDYLHRSRSSNIGDSTTRDYDLKSHRSLDRNYARNYNSRGGGYRTQDRRPSPPERNNGGYSSYSSYRGPPPARSHSRDRYRYHSQEYHDPKPHFTPNFNRPVSQPRSRSGSPIAWNFQKRKNASPERSAKCFDDHRRFKRQDYVTQRYEPPGYEKSKPDDYYRFNRRYMNGYYEKVNRVGRDDGARRVRYAHNRE